MLNNSEKIVVYLDSETLRYMFMSFSKVRNYPVMNQLYSVLNEGFTSNNVVTPLMYDHIYPYVKGNQIERKFFDMMGGISQIQFHQKFTVKTLQLIRVINSFFSQTYKKPVWQDAFAANPDERYIPSFNKFCSISAQVVINSVSREKKLSQIYDFIEGYRNNTSVYELAVKHYQYLIDQFTDLIIPNLPQDGIAEYHIKSFLKNEDIKEIPEFNILSNVLFAIFESYNFDEIEQGTQDNILAAAENLSVYMPYCHYYVTTVDIAELVNMSGLNKIYEVNVYDNNESSLYQLINDITAKIREKKIQKDKESQKTVFRKGGYI